MNMRLDKFLKVSRLIKRRTVANEVSDMGRVLINGNPAKAAKQVKENDIITIEYANRTVKAKILKVPTGNVSIQESSNLYELLD
jgi:ribosomal 50S subunit-recycling heat shock protein